MLPMLPHTYHLPGLSSCPSLCQQEAQLPYRDRMKLYVSKFMLSFTDYGSYKGFKQQK